MGGKLMLDKLAHNWNKINGIAEFELLKIACRSSWMQSAGSIACCLEFHGLGWQNSTALSRLPSLPPSLPVATYAIKIAAFRMSQIVAAKYASEIKGTQRHC